MAFGGWQCWLFHGIDKSAGIIGRYINRIQITIVTIQVRATGQQRAVPVLAATLWPKLRSNQFHALINNVFHRCRTAQPSNLTGFRALGFHRYVFTSLTITIF